MATRAYQPDPLDTLLAAIPSLPRPILARLVARMIERMDEIDGDADDEDSEASSPHVDTRGRPIPGLWIAPGYCEDDEEGECDEDTHDAEEERY